MLLFCKYLLTSHLPQGTGPFSEVPSYSPLYGHFKENGSGRPSFPLDFRSEQPTWAARAPTHTSLAMPRGSQDTQHPLGPSGLAQKGEGLLMGREDQLQQKSLVQQPRAE